MKVWFPKWLFLALIFLSRPSQAMILQLDTEILGQKVLFASELYDWLKKPMTETKPGHYEIQFEDPWLHQFAYKFIVDGRWIQDPRNPLTTPDHYGGWNSIARVPDFHEDPWLLVQPGSTPLLESHLTLSDWEGTPRDITVLSPPQRKQESVTVYFQDGGDYLNQAEVRALFANLATDPTLPAITAVFIPPKDRIREYELLTAYTDFVSRDVVNLIEHQFPGTGGARNRRLLVGPSLGGLITLQTALLHPDVFELAASQSGSIWWNNAEILEMLKRPITQPSLRLKLFLDCGSFEAEQMWTFNRQAATVARQAGHDVVYHEYPSTHDWIAWRNRLQEIIRTFFTYSKSHARVF
ncbi:alpha/beta hydrolase-fold protein [Bdellovibrionota bacterium FG-1]